MQVDQAGRVGIVVAVALFVCFHVSPVSVRTLPDRPGSPGPANQPDQPRPRGRLFPPQDLGLLATPDREQWQKPDLIMDELKIFDGAIVADLGAGGGWFTVRLARRVGPNGVVYAQDVQALMIEAIRRRIQSENLGNVRTVLGTASDPKLPKGVLLDAALIVDAFREMEDTSDPAAIVTLLRHVARSLKPQGRLGIVDFLPGGGGPGPAPDERVNPQQVIETAAAAGLQRLSQHTVPPFQFLLVFGKGGGAPSAP